MTKIQEKLRKYPFTEMFMVVDTIGVPHPFCIGTRHVAYAAAHNGGMLTSDAIERSGAPCCTCAELVRKGKQQRILSCKEHETALLVQVTDPEKRGLKDVPGLHEYLLSLKEMAEQDGYAGFAFTTGE